MSAMIRVLITLKVLPKTRKKLQLILQMLQALVLPQVLRWLNGYLLHLKVCFCRLKQFSAEH